MSNTQVAALNRAVDGLAGSVTHLSLHTSDGGGSGSDEVSGGNYTRQAPTYVPAVDGESDVDEPVVFGAPVAPAEVTHVGFWDDTEWLGSRSLVENDEPVSKIISGDDTLRVNSAPVVNPLPE